MSEQRTNDSIPSPGPLPPSLSSSTQGLVGGGYNGTLAATISNNFPAEVAASALSMSYSFFTYGGLAGPVISGYIIYRTGSYIGMMMFSGSIIMLAFVSALALRMYMARGKIFVNV